MFLPLSGIVLLMETRVVEQGSEGYFWLLWGH